MAVHRWGAFGSGTRGDSQQSYYRRSEPRDLNYLDWMSDRELAEHLAALEAQRGEDGPDFEITREITATRNLLAKRSNGVSKQKRRSS